GPAGAPGGAAGGPFNATSGCGQRRWRHRLRRRRAARAQWPLAQLPAGHVPLISRLARWLRLGAAPVDDTLWNQVCAALPWARRLDTQRRARLRALTTRFLHE